MLEPEHRVGIEEVRLALATPLVLASHLEAPVRRRDAARRIRDVVARLDLGMDDVEVDSAEARDRAREVALDELVRQADGLEDLRAAVGAHRRHAHLGHDLEQALAQGLHEIAHGLLRGDPGEDLAVDEVLHGLHREVGIDGRGPVAHQQSGVMDLPDVTRFDDERRLGARLATHEMVMDR